MTDKPNPCFIDTNVLVYAYSETEPEKKQIAVQLLTDRSICMSTQVVNEFVWIMSSKYRVDMKLLSDVAKNLFLLYRMDIVDDRTIAAAIEMSMRYRLSYWDSLIVSSAMKRIDSSIRQDMYEVKDKGLNIIPALYKGLY